MNDNVQIKRKCISFAKINELTVRILDSMQGIYGKQFTAEKLDGEEVFLPSNMNLNRELSKFPVGIAVEIKLLEAGNAKKASTFEVTPIKRADFEEKANEIKAEKYEDYL